MSQERLSKLPNYNVRLAKAIQELASAKSEETIAENLVEIVYSQQFLRAKELDPKTPVDVLKARARTTPEYIEAIHSFATAQRRRMVAQGTVEILRAEFDEWRTVSANNRYNL